MSRNQRLDRHSRNSICLIPEKSDEQILLLSPCFRQHLLFYFLKLNENLGFVRFVTIYSNNLNSLHTIVKIVRTCCNLTDIALGNELKDLMFGESQVNQCHAHVVLKQLVEIYKLRDVKRTLRTDL